MNAERLLAHYQSIADAPDAIALLRRFILNLAVCGRLVPHDPNDESASELIKRIAAEKSRLVKAGNVRTQQLEGLGPAEAPFAIPAHWAWTRLGSIGDWGSGSTPTRENPDLYGGSITWLKSGELNDDRHLTGSDETVTELALRRGSFRLNRPGDVLFAMYGATIGKVAILAEEAVTNQAVCGCTPFPGVFNQFLFLFLLSQRERFHAASEGGAQPNLSKVKIVRTSFPLPPLAEQHRIVAKVDELMVLCDRLETGEAEREATREQLTAASLGRLNDPDPETFSADVRFVLDKLPVLTARHDQIRHLRQTILNLAVRGKLVAQDPNHECVAKRYEKEATSEDLPANWRLLNFGKFCDIQGGNQPPKSQFINEPREGYVQLFQIRDLGERPVPTYIPIGSTNRFCKKGDILIGRYGASVGKVFWAQNGAYNVALAKFIWPEDAVDRGFAFLLLKSEYFQGLLENANRSAQAGFNKGDLAEIDFPLPPLAEQHRIVAKVNELIALCDRLEASLIISDDTRRRLLDALMRGALAPAVLAARAG